ncbi:MAG: phenylacetic acid degradation bifunctional protein PaaZ, partial [Gammaproteobacteria bacterium]|nr:phenylacetic acid degradation bifunctional protein PaaZ [Gammaproteobacteria bacterium]
MKIQSYVAGEWCSGDGRQDTLINSVNDAVIGEVHSLTFGFDQFLEYGRNVAGPALRKLTIHERAERIKLLAKYLFDRKDEFYRISYMTGATKPDSWVDIEGGIGTMFSYTGIARRELSNDVMSVEGSVELLSKNNTFVGQHILVPKPGVSVHINAFNFPVWGMLEKITPSIIAGMPVIVKPGTVTCYLTEAVVRAIVESKIFPEGTVQLICGGVGDLLNHLTEQDVVTFTGSASTGRKLRAHDNILDRNIPFNMEADSLNCCILGPDVKVEDPEFDLYVKEIAREMTSKAGQKCTAIRRAIMPSNMIDPVSEALIKRLKSTVIGDPTQDGVRMGALVGKTQRDDVLAAIEQLKQGSEVLLDGLNNFQAVGIEADKGAFMAPTLLCCNDPIKNTNPHNIEAFGPVSTLMPYKDLDEAIALAKMGKGSLAGSVFTANPEHAREIILNTAAYHGRMMVIDQSSAKESTGHGSPLASLVHGGPGRAGG